MNALHTILSYLAESAILLFEFVGVIIIIVSGIYGVINYIQRNPLTRLTLARGMAMALEFKLGSEILRTVLIRDLSEILNVAAIIALRGALAFLIHWEIKTHQSDSGIK